MYDLITTAIRNGHIWEEGGAFTNTGKATIICDKNGNKKTAVFVNHSPYYNSQVAKFRLQDGDIIIQANRWRDNLHIAILRYGNIPNFGEYTELLSEYTEKGWTCPFYAEKYKEAVDAAVEKSHCYHCKGMHYGIEPETRDPLEILENWKAGK